MEKGHVRRVEKIYYVEFVGNDAYYMHNVSISFGSFNGFINNAVGILLFVRST